MEFADLDVYTPPLSAELVDELVPFWQSIFEIPFDESRAVLAADEAAANRDTIWLLRSGEQLAVTCQLTVSIDNPELGGLGAVATADRFRRQGLAERLCREARDLFRSGGGRALFLGTDNPAAARVYYRLGWRKLTGTTVMVAITDDCSPEEFLVDYFRETGGAVTISSGTPGDRVAMIPLLVLPHDEQLLDGNLGWRSVRYAEQNRCMSLYPQYDVLAAAGGAWFTARSAPGRIVGLASCRPVETADQPGQACVQVDGFTHRVARPCWRELLDAAVDWARKQQAHECRAVTSVEDEGKRMQFEALGFRAEGAGDEINLDGRRVGTVVSRLRL